MSSAKNATRPNAILVPSSLMSNLSSPARSRSLFRLIAFTVAPGNLLSYWYLPDHLRRDLDRICAFACVITDMPIKADMNAGLNLCVMAITPLLKVKRPTRFPGERGVVTVRNGAAYLRKRFVFAASPTIDREQPPT